MHYGTFPSLTGTPATLRELVEPRGVEVLELKPGETAFFGRRDHASRIHERHRRTEKRTTKNKDYRDEHEENISS